MGVRVESLTGIPIYVYNQTFIHSFLLFLLRKGIPWFEQAQPLIFSFILSSLACFSYSNHIVLSIRVSLVHLTQRIVACKREAEEVSCPPPVPYFPDTVSLIN